MSYADSETNNSAGSFADEFEKYMNEKGNIKTGKVIQGKLSP